MSHEIVMPQLGISMDYGQIIEWLKKPGEAVKIGDSLFRVESDKATVDVECVADGTLQIVLGADAGDIPVGTVVGYILEPGDKAHDRVDKPVNQGAPAEGMGTDEKMEAASITMAQNMPAGLTTPSRRQPLSSPAARRRAQELAVDWKLAVGSGPAGRIKVRDVEALKTQQSAQLAPSSHDKISPVAQRLAEAVGLDTNFLVAQYPNTYIERLHVEQAIRGALKKIVMGSRDSSEIKETGGARREAMGGIRHLIAEHMVDSHQNSAPVTLTTEVNATELIRIRKTGKTDINGGILISYNAMLAKLSARLLLEYPVMNASLVDGEIVHHNDVNIGVAVDTERGLVVPVIRNVHRKTLEEITKEMDDLFSRTAQGDALADELTGGTFTITNLGRYDIDVFTPIINLPESAILGVGRLIEKVVALDGEMAIRTMMALSLTFDHRLVDGAPAARFLQKVKQYIEQPYLWLVSG